MPSPSKPQQGGNTPSLKSAVRPSLTSPRMGCQRAREGYFTTYFLVWSAFDSGAPVELFVEGNRHLNSENRAKSERICVSRTLMGHLWLGVRKGSEAKTSSSNRKQSTFHVFVSFVFVFKGSVRSDTMNTRKLTFKVTHFLFFVFKGSVHSNKKKTSKHFRFQYSNICHTYV